MFDEHEAEAFGIICGQVSGYLECIDIDYYKHEDGSVLAEDFLEMLRNHMPRFDDLFCMQKTQSGGIHLYYRAPAAVEPNRVLAKLNGVVFLETRGEGGYFLSYPSPGYELLQSSDLLPLSQEEYEILIHTAKALDTTAVIYERGQTEDYQNTVSLEDNLKPLDDYARTGDFLALLEKHGWSVAHDEGTSHYLTRPGKKKGISATLGIVKDNDGRPKLWNFTSSTSLRQCGLGDHAIGIVEAYTVLEHNGDYNAAAKHLYRIGYGTRITSSMRKKNLSQEIEEEKKIEVKQDKITKELIKEVLHQSDRGDALLFSKLCEHLYCYTRTRNKWLYYADGVWSEDLNSPIQLQITPVLAAQYGLLLEQAEKLFLEAVAEQEKLVEAAKQKESNLEDRVKLEGKIERLEAGRNMLTARIKKLYTLSKVRDVIGFAKEFLAVSDSDFDQDHDIINLKNGIYDLAKDEFRDHSYQDRCFLQAAASYDRNARCPEWEQFIYKIMSGDKERIEFLQQYVGYMLSGYASHQFAVYFYGNGANGKSVFNTTIRELLGTYATPMKNDILIERTQQSSATDYFTASIHGKRAIFFSEIQANKSLDEAQLKNITSGENIQARRPYGEPFSFEQTHKAILQGNHFLRIKNSDHGIWRRIRVVTFDYTFPQEEQKPMEKVLSSFRREFSGILNWAIAGYQSVQKNGWKKASRIESDTDRYRSEMNAFLLWVEDMVVKDPMASNLSFRELRESYESYCKINRQNVALKSQRMFNNQMREYLLKMGFEDVQDKRTSSGDYVINGLRLSQEPIRSPHKLFDN